MNIKQMTAEERVTIFKEAIENYVESFRELRGIMIDLGSCTEYHGGQIHRDAIDQLTRLYADYGRERYEKVRG